MISKKSKRLKSYKRLKNWLIVIPSRYASSRFPGKGLALLGGRSVVEWCYRAALSSGVGPVVIATEDRRVMKVIAAFGGRAMMTSRRCVSGSDRVYEASRRHGPTSYVFNLQGDLPLVKPSTLRKVAALLEKRRDADIVTAVIPLKDPKRIKDPNVVKAALCKDGRALYFSRAAIPFRRNGTPTPLYEQLGVYAFRRKALERFVKLPPSPLEKMESLEQLRAMEAGMKIYAAIVDDLPAAIDTPGDLKRTERLLHSIGRSAPRKENRGTRRLLTKLRG